ncbi:hypothetical protein ACWEQ4_01235 [Rhodococcus sp. NPDC003994]
MAYRYEEVTTGQVVTLVEPPFYLDGLARWVRTEVELRAPEQSAPAPDPEPLTDGDPVADAPAAYTEEQAEVPADTQPDVAPPLPLPVGLDRDEWLAYAHANGKTDDDTHGVRTKVIAGWFR